MMQARGSRCCSRHVHCLNRRRDTRESPDFARSFSRSGCNAVRERPSTSCHPVAATVEPCKKPKLHASVLAGGCRGSATPVPRRPAALLGAFRPCPAAERSKAMSPQHACLVTALVHEGARLFLTCETCWLLWSCPRQPLRDGW